MGLSYEGCGWVGGGSNTTCAHPSSRADGSAGGELSCSTAVLDPECDTVWLWGFGGGPLLSLPPPTNSTTHDPLRPPPHSPPSTPHSPTLHPAIAIPFTDHPVDHCSFSAQSGMGPTDAPEGCAEQLTDCDVSVPYTVPNFVPNALREASHSVFHTLPVRHTPITPLAPLIPCFLAHAISRHLTPPRSPLATPTSRHLAPLVRRAAPSSPALFTRPCARLSPPRSTAAGARTTWWAPRRTRI